MLSIQAVRGLPRLRAPGIVPRIISFSMQKVANTTSGTSVHHSSTAMRPVNSQGMTSY